MPCKHADTESVCDGPHANMPVAAAGKSVGAVWMEAYSVHVFVMPNEHAEVFDSVGPPEASSSIKCASQEV